MEHPNEQLIGRFYTAFSDGDAEGMGGCYHENVQFSDPVFGRLDGREVRAMWRMLLERSRGNLKVSFGDIHADDYSGRVRWEAVYPFSKTGRMVHNHIDATFRIKDGLIVQHDDRFSLWRWAAMALGPIGLVLGGTPIVRAKLRRDSRALLDRYMRGEKRS